jgi:hypothetical protein
MSLPRGKLPWQWLVRTQTADGWKTSILPGGTSQHMLKFDADGMPRAVIVSAISRLGREGRPTRVEVEKRN